MNPTEQEEKQEQRLKLKKRIGRLRGKAIEAVKELATSNEERNPIRAEMWEKALKNLVDSLLIALLEWEQGKEALRECLASVNG